MATSKNVIANLALSRLGNFSSAMDIDFPKEPIERVLAKWFDPSRRMAIKEILPNFALARDK